MGATKLTQLNPDVPETKEYFGEVATLLKKAGIHGLTKQEFIDFCKGHYVTKGDKYTFLNKSKEFNTPEEVRAKVIKMMAKSPTLSLKVGKFVTFSYKQATEAKPQEINPKGILTYTLKAAATTLAKLADKLA